VHRVIVLLSATMLAGCGGDPDTAEAIRTVDELKALAVAYDNFRDQHAGGGPREPRDLDDYLKDAPAASAGIKKGRFVVLYRISKVDLVRDGPEVVLAYEKSVLKTRGWVLFADGSVRNLSSAEWQDAPKARHQAN
jgi:hypothetical protein